MKESTNVINFKIELKELLGKYKATIGFGCDDCSDIYGLYGEYIAVWLDDEAIKLVDGWGVSSSDID